MGGVRRLWRRTPLLRFLTRRVVASLLLGIGITLVAFCLTNLIPGDPAAANLSQQALTDPEIVAAFREKHELDQPLPTQYVRYLRNLVSGDLGVSLQSGRPVLDDLHEYATATLEVAGAAMVISMVFGVLFGVVAALGRDGPIDQVLRVVTLVGVSVPIFWLALVAYYVIFYKLNLLPGSGRLDPIMIAPKQVTGLLTVDSVLAGDWAALRSASAHLILPALVLATPTIGLLTRFVRAAVLEVLADDYVRAARAKGLPERTVIVHHVLRAAAVPIVTLLGLTFSALLSGTVLVEAIFAWPGIGQYAYRGATTLDLPAVIGVSLFVAFVYVSLNLFVDLLYGVLDPRLRLK